jgi:lipopolysaccharide transport system ATP-binding protein
LGFAVATALNPDVLILDEVLAVGDAAFRVKCFNRMTDVLQNAAVIFVSHNMPQMTRICNRIMFLQQGRTMADSSDLGMVIAKYHERIQLNRSQSVLGTGKTRIHSVSVVDEAGRKVPRLVHGLPFAIVVRFSPSGDLNLRDSRVLITICDEEQNNVVQIAQPLGETVASAMMTLKMTFDRTLFNAGRFSVNIGILTASRGELTCVVHNAAEFVVEHTSSGYAPIHLYPVRVELESSPGCNPLASGVEVLATKTHLIN